MASSARIEELRKKFEENPRRYFAPLANEYRKAGDIDQAIAICREYLPQQPGHMSGHIVYGQALFEAKQAEEAKTVFETALSLDPENLIALRHLGDIALLVGDNEAARMWYGRVLEADPRNEEIQAQLAALGAAGGPGTPTPVASVPTVEVPVSQPAAAAPTLEVPVTQPSSTAPVTAQSPTEEIRLDSLPTTATSPTREFVPPVAPAPSTPAPEPVSPPALDIGFEPTSVAPPAESAAAATLVIDAPVSANREAPPMGSFSLEGLETTSLSTAPLPAPPATPATPATPPTPTVDLDFGAPSAAPPEPVASMAVDLDFGAPAAAAAPQPSAAPTAAEADEMPLLDIGELPSTPPPAPAAAELAAPQAMLPAPEPSLEPVLEAVPPLEFEAPPPADPTAEPEPSTESAPVAPESGPFVTETMADLYLRQGHREEALRVYRALLEQRPDDAALAAKVESLSPPPAAEDAAGPTIRDLLMAIASRRPGFRQEHPRGNGAAPGGAGSGLQDALATLFEGGATAEADEQAAVSLGYAFMSLDTMERDAQPAQVGGAPARQASDPLSLDSVFKGADPQQAPSNFSFDQFFSQRATSEHAAQSGIPAPRADESKDDVAQFTQWLQGLKQQ